MELSFYITELSRYVIALLFVLYILETGLCLWRSVTNRHEGICFLQILLMIFIHFSCFLTICFQTGDFSYLVFYLFQQIFLLAMVTVFPLAYPKANRVLFNCMCMLLTVGFVILTRLSFEKALRQFFIAAIAMAIAMFIPYFLHRWQWLRKLGWLYALIGACALGLVLLLGAVTNGSKISYTLWGVTFQPSELVKLLFVLFLAAALYQKNDLKQVLFTAIVAAVHVLILVASNDLGSALIFFLVYVLMVFIATRKWRYLWGGLGVGVVASVAAYFLFSHVQVRVLAWLDPWTTIDAEGYQISQSLFAISGGGLFGLGLFSGNPTSIPYVEADFIFSAVAEELGLVFAVCLVLLCLLCFILCMKIAWMQKDRFCQLLAFGLGVVYIVQVFLTVGGGVKFIPMTGVTLPLVSYGGTSVLTTILLFFLVEGLCIRPNFVPETSDEVQSTQADIQVASNKKRFAFHKKQDELFETEAQPTEKKKTLPQVVVVSVAFSVLFVCMLAYTCIYSVNHKQEMADNSYNTHQQLLAAENIRGSIYASDGQVLAETETDADGTETRVYPFGSLFSHVVGYSTKGKSGLESTYNYYLLQANASLTWKAAEEEAGQKFAADSLYTTLDVDLQQAANSALGAYKGAVIVTEPSTGKILAMVSKPDFDPNEISEIWDDLLEDEDSGRLVNRATQGLYPPGSTFKIVTALEYIRENPDTYMNYRYSCNGHFTSGTYTINCYHGTSHGSLDFTTSFAKSCNSSFANIGLSLNRSSFAKTLSELLFNENLPVDFAYSKSHVNVSEDTTDEEMMQLVIGQGTDAITPLHLNMITAAIANGGVLMTPYLADRVVAADGSIVKRFSASEYGRLMSEEEAEILTEMMEAVVQSGTATKLKGQSYTVAGKTGSAEYNSDKDSHAWFTGFAPVEDPEICVTVIIEGAGSGGDMAVPVARRVFNAYFE